MTAYRLLSAFCFLTLLLLVWIWIHLEDDRVFKPPKQTIPDDKLPEVKKKVQQLLHYTPHKKILLWGYFRGGSSLAGKLLSASRGRYVFEPLQPYSSMPSNWTRLTEALEEVFGCPSAVCIAFPYTLAKVNRLEGKPGRKWLQHHPDIKVVHLLRDPRAILASRERSKEKPKKPLTMRNVQECRAEVLCNNMMDDITHLQSLPPHRYLMVKYEDLINNMNVTLENIYEFMSIPFFPAVISYILHNSSGKETDPYSLNRNPNTFDKDKWKKFFDKDKINDIQQKCAIIMNYLNYTNV